MKKFYKIITLILLLIFLTTYTPNTLFLFKENENSFFKITNIEITNNTIINNTSSGIKLSSNQDDVEIVGNTIDNNGYSMFSRFIRCIL